jgi:hypothetical protein
MPIELDPLTGASWYYSNESAFDLFNGIPATDVETDLDDNSTRNSDVLAAAGARADTYIDSKLKSFGWAVPLTGMDARTAALLQDLSNHATRWQLAESRNWGLYAGQNISAQDQAKMGYADRKYVDDWLKSIDGEPGILTADGAPEGNGEGGFESLNVIDSSEQCTTDENGVMIPPESWWLP